MEVYRITEAASGRSAVISWPGSVPAGDLDLWSAVAPYLVGPRVALGGVRDPLTGERGSRLALLEPGSRDWLLAGLHAAAEALDLQVTPELP